MNKPNTMPQTIEEALAPNENKKKNWSVFIESDAANFFIQYNLEKMTIDDGCGNKAKMTRTKDNEIKVEYTSSVTL